MEGARQAGKVSTVFKFVDLCRSYLTRIEKLNVLKTAKEGRNILFAFQEDIGQVLRKAYEKDYDDVAMHLATAANIVRKDMLDMQATFTESLDENYHCWSAWRWSTRVPASKLSPIGVAWPKQHYNNTITTI